MVSSAAFAIAFPVSELTGLLTLRLSFLCADQRAICQVTAFRYCRQALAMG